MAGKEPKEKIVIRFNENDKRVEKLYGVLGKNDSSPEEVIARVLRHEYLSQEDGRK